MIKINNLAFSYGDDTVLKNISMKLEDGKIYGLLGENGVGKTTLLTLLAGLKKPQAGTIVYDKVGAAEGVQPYSRQPELLEEIYYLPDEVAPIHIKAREFAEWRGVFRKDFSIDTFLKIMEEFEVNPDQKMNAMSQGQLKKTYIAFALASGVKYLFMDEPTNGLDIPSKSQFRKALMTYTREDSTVVISTHQVRDLENVIDPIVILERQEVLLNASLEEIADKLFFDYGTTLHAESLYSEQLAGGFIQVYPNTQKEDSKVNLEALFNATHANKEIVKALFSNE